MGVAFKIRADYNVKLDPSYLSRIERGKVEIPLRTLFALADYFDVNPLYLLDMEKAEGDGGEYILEEPDLNDALRKLREKLGEDSAKEYVGKFIKQILAVVDDSTTPRPQASVLEERETAAAENGRESA